MFLNYFTQGFLFTFSLSSPPFLEEVKEKNKIDTYWEKTANYIATVFNEQKKDKNV